ncbi:MAG: G1 family glutamic endopeptidase [Nitrosopumilaceae archaeon]
MSSKLLYSIPRMGMSMTLNTKKYQVALFSALIFTLIIPVSGMNIATGQTIDEIDACADKVDEQLRVVHGQFNIDKAEAKVLNSQQFREKTLNKNFESLGASVESSVDKDCNLQAINTFLIFEITEETQKTTEKQFKDILKIKIDNTSYDVKEIIEQQIVNHQNAGFTYSLNWSGYTMYDKPGSTYLNVNYARARFNVPDISDPTIPTGFNCTGTDDDRCAMSIWAGISRDQYGSVLMAQTGVEGDCLGNNCANGETYQMFTEMVGVPHQNYCSGTVHAGDSMTSTTSHSVSGSTHTYQMTTFDYTTGQICSASPTSTSSNGQTRYAQYITERPQTGSEYERLPAFPDFQIRGNIKRSDGVLTGIQPVYNAGQYFAVYMTHNSFPPPTGTVNVQVGAVGATTVDYFLVDYKTSYGTE